MKTNQIVLLAVAVIVIAAACIGMYVLSDKGGNSLNNSSGIVDSDYYPVTVTTSIGGVNYSQTFTQKPERIITVWSSNLELMHYFGLEDRVVGAFAADDYIVLNDELQGKYDGFSKRPENSLSLEVVRSLEPDIIIGWSSTFSDSSWGIGTVSTLNGYGANCYATNRPSSSVEDYLILLENIGIIFNIQDVSSQKIGEWNTRLENIREKTANINESEKVTALVIEIASHDGETIVYGSSFLTGDLVTKAGGINLFNGSMEELTNEKIVSLNPDVVFLMSGHEKQHEPAQIISDFKSTPAFASMTDNVVFFHFNELYMGGILSETILDEMFEAMYPELA